MSRGRRPRKRESLAGTRSVRDRVTTAVPSIGGQSSGWQGRNSQSIELTQDVLNVALVLIGARLFLTGGFVAFVSDHLLPVMLFNIFVSIPLICRTLGIDWRRHLVEAAMVVVAWAATRIGVPRVANLVGGQEKKGLGTRERRQSKTSGPVSSLFGRNKRRGRSRRTRDRL